MDQTTSAAAQQRELLRRLLLEKAQKSRQAPTSSAQRQLWFMHKLDERNAAYNNAIYVTQRGLPARQLGQAALEQVCVERPARSTANRCSR